MFLGGTTFFIGEEAAGKIISYAKECGVESDYEHYRQDAYLLAGTITEIGKDYILVSDADLCEKKKDGIVFKVPTEKITIKRYVEYQGMKVGDMIWVEFYEGIDVENENLVCGVWEIGWLMNFSR